MEFKQNFMKEDQEELKQLFIKTMEPIVQIWRNKYLKSFLYIITFIAFVNGILIFFIEGRHLTDKAILCIALGIISFGITLFFRFMEQRAINLPQKRVLTLFSSPSLISVNEEFIVYHGQEYYYRDVKNVFQYKQFLIICESKRYIVMKANSEEQNLLLEILRQYSQIQFEEKDEVFRINQYMKRF